MTFPVGVDEYLAEQLDVVAASMATSTQREKTRLEHQWEIARDVGYRDFVDAEAELAVSSPSRPSSPMPPYMRRPHQLPRHPSIGT